MNFCVCLFLTASTYDLELLILTSKNHTIVNRVGHYDTQSGGSVQRIPVKICSLMFCRTSTRTQITQAHGNDVTSKILS